MLNTGTRPLRFCSIDMRARWRRRVAVMLTYSIFGLGILALQSHLWNPLGHPYWAMWSLCFLVAFTGVFRNGGLVKSFDVSPQGPPKTMTVGTLDEWARYRYGTAGFHESTAEQQAELLKSYRVGTYVVPWGTSRQPRPWLLDERETAQRDRVSRRTLVWLGTYTICVAGSYASRLERSTTTGDVVAVLLTIAVLALTLPKAMVLWEEPDPREVSEELGPLENNVI